MIKNLVNKTSQSTSTEANTATSEGKQAGIALKALYTQYKADGKFDMTNLNNLMNLTTLSNNIKIDFDKRGRWKSITANVSLPLEILPVQAREYLEANYPNQIVVEIDREVKGYDVGKILIDGNECSCFQNYKIKDYKGEIKKYLLRNREKYKDERIINKIIDLL